MADLNQQIIATARGLIGKFRDGPDVPVLAQAIGHAYPEMAAYCAMAVPTTSWCGIFNAYVQMLCGVRPAYVPNSNDYDDFMWADAPLEAHWGTVIPRGQEQPGDTVVLHSPHHITFFDADDGDHFWGIGGNQSDAVTRARFSWSGVRAVVRSPAQGEVLQPAIAALFSGSGKGSWFSQYQGRYSWVDTGDRPGSNALGVPDDQQGIALPGRATLGHWFDVQAPNGVTLRLRQTDLGPGVSTGRTIDIAAAAAERFGYAPTNFPTDGIFKWRPATGATVTPSPIPQLKPARAAAIAAVEAALAHLKETITMDESTQINVPQPTAPRAPQIDVQVPQPAPAPSPAGMHFDLGAAMAYVQANPQMGQAALGLLAAALGLQPPPGTAATAPATTGAPPKHNLLDLITGILTTVTAGGLIQNGTVGVPFTQGSSIYSLLTAALPIALTIFGAVTGGKSSIIGNIFASIAKQIPSTK